MTAIQLLSCAGLIVGAFLLLHLKPVEFTDSLFAFLLRPKKGIRDKLKESSGRKSRESSGVRSEKHRLFWR